MGFGTERVATKALNKNALNSKQVKGLQALQNICGVKKNPEKIEDDKII